MDDDYPEVTIADASDYDRATADGYVIVQLSGLVGADGPVYCWPIEWASHPERKGVFPTLQDAQRALGMILN